MNDDTTMTRHAADRGPVLVEHPSGRAIVATLRAWRPHRTDGRGNRRRRDRATVEFASGKTASVRLDRVHILLPPTESGPT